LPEDISDLDPYSEPAVSILKNQQDILRLFPSSSMSTDNNSSSALVPNRVETFYGIPYRQDPFPVQALSQWSAAREHGAASVGELESAIATGSLGLPEFNPYVSKDLTLNTNGSSPASLSSFRGLIRSAFPVQIVSSSDYSDSTTHTHIHTHDNKNDLHSNSNKHIMVTASSSLWLSRDELFGLPKAAITCFLHNPYCGKLVFLFNIKI
jgi:secreted Zn-dependent insulinase-like peptidase